MGKAVNWKSVIATILLTVLSIFMNFSTAVLKPHRLIQNIPVFSSTSKKISIVLMWLASLPVSRTVLFCLKENKYAYANGRD